VSEVRKTQQFGIRVHYKQDQPSEDFWYWDEAHRDFMADSFRSSEHVDKLEPLGIGADRKGLIEQVHILMVARRGYTHEGYSVASVHKTGGGAERAGKRYDGKKFQTMVQSLIVEDDRWW
jgi:hypothetical protein